MMYELIIAMIISGLAITAAMNLPVTLVKFLSKIQTTIYGDIDICKFINQLDKDFSTSFIPQSLESDLSSTTTDQKSSETIPEATSDNNKKESTEKPLADKKNQKVYFSVKTQADDNLDYCFCVNTNPFNSKSTVKSKIANVFYKLEKTDKLFNLYRYETDKQSLNLSEDIDFEAIKKNRVLIMKGLTSLKINLKYFSKEHGAELKSTETSAVAFVEKESRSWPCENSEPESLPHTVSIESVIKKGNLEEKFLHNINIFSAFKIAFLSNQNV